MANLTYAERVALEQQKEALRRQREDERRNGVAGVRANDSRMASNFDAMHGRAGRKWLGGESGAVSSGDALHGMAGRKWLGGGGEPQPQSSSRVTAFGTSGNGDATWYDNMDPIGARARTAAWEAERVLRDRAYADQRSSFDEMAQVMDATKRKKAQQQLSFMNDVAGMMKLARGGIVPNEVRDLVNRRYGFDGVKTGVLPNSGFTANGAFNVVFGQEDGMGGVAAKDLTFSPLQQYEIMNVNQAAFDDNDRGALRQRLIDSGYSEKELGVFEQQGANWRRDLAEQKQKQSNDAAKRKEMGERIKLMTTYLQDLNNIEIYPDQGSEEVEAEKKNIREQLAQARREYFHRTDAVGQTAPTQTGAPAPQGGVTNPQGKPVAANVNVPEAGGGEPASGGASPSAAAPTATNPQGGAANGGKVMTPQEKAEAEEIHRIMAMRGGQKLLNVVRGGRNVTMNGYEHNGRFYDAKGNLMTDVEDTFEVEGSPTEIEVSDEEVAANPRMRTFTQRGEDGSMKRYRRDFSGVRYVRSKDRAQPTQTSTPNPTQTNKPQVAEERKSAPVKSDVKKGVESDAKDNIGLDTLLEELESTPEGKQLKEQARRELLAKKRKLHESRPVNVEVEFPEDERYRKWYVEHGNSSLSEEENYRRFEEYDKKQQDRLRVVGTGPKEDRWSRMH